MDKTTKIYIYEMRSRPPSIGTHPTEGLIRHEEGGDRHGFLLYDRQLTSDEIYNYELRTIAVMRLEQWEAQ